MNHQDQQQKCPSPLEKSQGSGKPQDSRQEHSHSFMVDSLRRALGSSLDQPVEACYRQEEDGSQLWDLPDPDIASVKAAFLPSALADRKGRTCNMAAAAAAGLGPMASLTSSPRDGRAAASIDQVRLDHPFTIGFSPTFGHGIQLSPGSDHVDSGAFLFESNELPYASTIEPFWRGKLCEECLRLLPSDPSHTVECPGCPTAATSDQDQEDGDSKESSRADGMGTPRFCGEHCLEQAWKTWHGYECGHDKVLRGLSRATRLALRAYWRNCQTLISLVASTALARLTLSESSQESDPSSTVENIRRVSCPDGSYLLPSELCHHFSSLDPARRTSFIMTGYYLQQTLDLPEDATMELAHLQSLVQFNSFAIKSRVEEQSEGSDNMKTLQDFTIGSGLYLLASMFNHSCAPNAMVVFGKDGKPSRTNSEASEDGLDPRTINIVTTKTLKANKGSSSLPVSVEISYGPQGGRMATEERKAYLRASHLFECNCSACNDKFAETILQHIYKCPKNGYSCRPMTEKATKCPTCGAEIDTQGRRKLHKLMSNLMAETQNPTLTLPQQLTVLKTLESTQSKVFVNTFILYGNTCDQLAMIYAEMGDLNQSIDWCKKAYKVVMVHFPHDSIEVAQETLKLAGLLFNNMQPKEAMKYVQQAITLFKGHYGANSQHPDLLELYEMEAVLKTVL